MGPLVGLERQPIVGLEVARRPGGVDPLGAQVRIADAAIDRLLGQTPRSLDPGRAVAICVEGPATLAGPIARHQAFLDRTEELHVLGPWRSRSAAGPAEYAGRSNGREEDAPEARVSFGQGAMHDLHRR